MRVIIATYCDSKESLYGNLLVFRTLRTGFPTAEIVVYDNSPHKFPDISQAARKVGASYIFSPGFSHEQHIRRVLASEKTSCVLVDPDVIFWESLENEAFPDTVDLAGRYIPGGMEDVRGRKVTPRLHTSLLFMPNPERLNVKLRMAESLIPDLNLIASKQIVLNGTYRVGEDTLAGLCNAFPESCHSFPARILDKYDHLFVGTHLAKVERLTQIPGLRESHEIAMIPDGDLSKLRGLWREQAAYFEQQSGLEPSIGPLQFENPVERRNFLVDPLEEFSRWWLGCRAISPPSDSSSITIDGFVTGTVLYRDGDFQVQLFIIAPRTEIPEHSHPDIDTRTYADRPS